MATQRVIQYVAGGKNKLPAVHLHCRVKPNASKSREGVTSVTDDAVELCVAAVPRDGESNKAVLAVLSEVSEQFGSRRALAGSAMLQDDDRLGPVLSSPLRLCLASWHQLLS